MAQDFDLPLFDTLYHAATLEENSPFVTADERNYVKAASMGGIALLKDYMS